MRPNFKGACTHPPTHPGKGIASSAPMSASLPGSSHSMLMGCPWMHTT